MDTQPYLNRINFQSKPEVSKAALFELQHRHLLHIPFENLDIHYHTPIELDLQKIYQKIVPSKRGGFCYELNGLFNELLQAIGFDTFLISARVHGENGRYSPEFDHMAIVATVEGRSYLVDAGFGKFSLEPLEIVLDAPQTDPAGVFMVDRYEAGYYRVSSQENGNWSPEYIFKLEERQLADFEPRCAFQQSSEDAHFTRKKVISIARPNGRITLNNDTLKIAEGGEVRTVEFEETEFERYLETYFGVVL